MKYTVKQLLSLFTLIVCFSLPINKANGNVKSDYYSTVVASFTVNTPTQCITGNQFIFTNTSQSNCGCLKYFWDFGDGTNSTLANPSKTYTSGGSYLVKMIAVDDLNQKDSATIYLNVAEPSVVEFSIDPTINQCFNGNNFTFTNSTHSNYSGLKYVWDLGNGVISTETNTSTKYNAPGTYTVTLTSGYSSSGCTATLSKTVHVYPSPKADFNLQTDNTDAKKIKFTNASTVTSGSLNYKWYFGDNNKSGLENPTYTYSKPGIYNVTLIALTDANGCVDSVSKSIVIGSNPSAGFGVGVGTQCLDGNSFQFTNTSLAPLGATLSYAWDFGDGTVSSAANPLKSYTTAGTYKVKLIATANGFTDSAFYSVTVLASPVSSFNINEAAEKCLSDNNTYTFINHSTVPDNETVNYTWDLGDGRTVTTINTTNAYNKAGVYAITLTAVLNNGCTSSSTKTITLHSKPNAAFVWGPDKQDYHQIDFENNSSDANGNALNYQWNFGDAHTSTNQNPFNVYAANGNYDVSLKAISADFGCSDEIVKTITVKDSLYAIIVANIACQCAYGNTFQFVSKVGGSLGTYTYDWDFGDGTHSSAQNPTKKYDSPGDYTVALTIAANGKSTTTNYLIRVYATPVAAFDTIRDVHNANQFTFHNTSTIAIGSMTYVWNFGDGTSSTEQHPVKQFSHSGYFNVVLKAVGTDGTCADSISKQIHIDSVTNNYQCNLSAAFDINNYYQCVTDNAFTFINQTTGGYGTLTYTWDFNDGTYSHEANPTKKYTGYSDHDVSLTVTDSKGCYSNTVRQITVGSVPAASFNIFYNSFNGSGTTFISTSSIPSGNMSYAWDLGNGTTSNLVNPTVLYNPGTYTVKLVVQGIGSCKDSISKSVTIIGNPVADFTFTRSGCSGSSEAFNFQNLTSGGTAPYTYSWDFGDGITSTLANPSHTYLYANTYNVTLRVTDASGKQSQKSVSVQSMAASKPTASFTVLSNTQNGNSFTYLSTSSIPSGWMNYYWELGNGQTSTVSNPTVTYANVGNYWVKLVVTGSTGCKDSVSQVINVATVNASGNNASSNIVVDINPNPANSNTVLSFRPTFVIHKVNVKILNGVGQIVSQQTVTPNQSGAVMSLPVNVASLQKGYYFVILSDEQNQRIGTTAIMKY